MVELVGTHSAGRRKNDLYVFVCMHERGRKDGGAETEREREGERKTSGERERLGEAE